MTWLWRCGGDNNDGRSNKEKEMMIMTLVKKGMMAGDCMSIISETGLCATETHVKLSEKEKKNQELPEWSSLTGGPTYSWADGCEFRGKWLKRKEQHQAEKQGEQTAQSVTAKGENVVRTGVRRNRNTNTLRCKREVQLGALVTSSLTGWNNLPLLIAPSKSFTVLHFL